MTDATIRVVAADLAILINQLTHSDGQLEEAMEADRKWKEINDELKLRFATFRMNITIALGFEWGDKPRSDAELVELVRDAVLVRNRKAPEWAAAEGPFVDGWVCPACGGRNFSEALVCGHCVGESGPAMAGVQRPRPINLILADDPPPVEARDTPAAEPVTDARQQPTMRDVAGWVDRRHRHALHAEQANLGDTQAMPAVVEPRMFLPGDLDPGDISEVAERGNPTVIWRRTEDGLWFWSDRDNECTTDWAAMLTGSEGGLGVVEVVHDDVELVDEPGQENHRG